MTKKSFWSWFSWKSKPAEAPVREVAQETKVEPPPEELAIDIEGIKIFSSSLGAHAHNVDYEIRRNGGAIIVTAKLRFFDERSSFYRMNLLFNGKVFLDKAIQEKDEDLFAVIKDDASEWTVLISKEAFLKDNEVEDQIHGLVSHAYEKRLKGYRSEKLFKKILREVLVQHGLASLQIKRSVIHDRAGVDYFLKVYADGRPRFLNFQVKSSDVELEKKFFNDSPIYKVVVGDRPEKDISDEVWGLVRNFCKEAEIKYK